MYLQTVFTNVSCFSSKQDLSALTVTVSLFSFTLGAHFAQQGVSALISGTLFVPGRASSLQRGAKSKTARSQQRAIDRGIGKTITQLANLFVRGGATANSLAITLSYSYFMIISLKHICMKHIDVLLRECPLEIYTESRSVNHKYCENTTCVK